VERGWDWWNRLTSRKQFNVALKVVWRKLSVML
jgi:DNA-directed RNA polymerase specialized sigma subunit